MKEYMSVSTQNRTIIFSEVRRGDRLLFMYGSGIDVGQPFHSFIRGGLEMGDLCVYATNANDARFYPQHIFEEHIRTGRLNVLDMGEDCDHRLLEGIRNHVGSATNDMRLLIDFGNRVNSENINNILDFEKGIISSNPSMITVNAVHTDSMGCQLASEFMKIHTKLIISTQNESTAVLPVFYDTGPEHVPSLEIFSQDTVDHFVKKNLETIILCMLQRKPACGYDIIREIVARYNVLMSQGTVYPLMYSLKKREILRIEEGPTKARVYVPTDHGREVIKNRLNEIAKTYSYLINLVTDETETQDASKKM